MSSILDLQGSFARAEKRLARRTQASRRPRSDRGKFRLPPEVIAHLLHLLSGADFPGVAQIMRDLRRFCQAKAWSVPSRAFVYTFMQRVQGETLATAVLPEAARAALYNLSAETTVPTTQLAFYCFNYGDLAAIQFAASLPWLALYQAARMRGWRVKARGLLLAVLHARQISYD